MPISVKNSRINHCYLREMPSKSAAAAEATDVLGGPDVAALGFRICAARICSNAGGANPESHSGGGRGEEKEVRHKS